MHMEQAHPLHSLYMEPKSVSSRAWHKSSNRLQLQRAQITYHVSVVLFLLAMFYP